MTPTPAQIVIHTQADLESAWRRLMEPLGFGGRSLWLMLVEPDGTPLPQLVEIGETPASPVSGDADLLADLLRRLSTDSGSGYRAAFLMTRPGRGSARTNDRRWAGALYEACRASGTPCEIVHVATDDRVVPIPPDDVDLAALA